jgi:hypothetical protein
VYDRQLAIKMSLPSPFNANSMPRRKAGKNMLPENFVPGPHTVVFGRGKAFAALEGNKRLKAIVDSHLKRYSEARSKLDKSNIVSMIVSMVKQSTSVGAFIKLEEDGRYWELEDGTAREKIGCMLRDCLHSQYSSSTKAKIERRRVNRINELNQSVNSHQHQQQHDVYHGGVSGGANFSNRSSSANSYDLDYSQNSTCNSSHERNFSHHDQSYVRRNSIELNFSDHHGSASHGADFGVICQHSLSAGLDFNNSFSSSGLDFNNINSSFASGRVLSNGDFPNHIGPDHGSYPGILSPSSVFVTNPETMGTYGPGAIPTNPLLDMRHEHRHQQNPQPQQPQQQHRTPPTKNILPNYRANGPSHALRANTLLDLMPMSAHIDIMGASSHLSPSTIENALNTSISLNPAYLVQRSTAAASNIISSPNIVRNVQRNEVVAGGGGNDNSNNDNTNNNNNNNNNSVDTSHNVMAACEVAEDLLAQSSFLSHIATLRDSSGMASDDSDLPDDISNIFDDT